MKNDGKEQQNFSNEKVLQETFPHANLALTRIIAKMFGDNEPEIGSSMVTLLDPEKGEEEIGKSQKKLFGYDYTTYFDKSKVSDMLSTVTRLLPEGKDPDLEIDAISTEVVRLVKENRPWNFAFEINQVLNDRYGETTGNGIMNALREHYPDFNYYLDGIDPIDNDDDDAEINDEEVDE